MLLDKIKLTQSAELKIRYVSKFDSYIADVTSGQNIIYKKNIGNM